MIPDIRKLVDAEPFVPFSIHMAGGKLFRVPTVDHIAVGPGGKKLVVFGDDGDYNVLSPLLIAHLNVDHGDPIPAQEREL